MSSVSVVIPVYNEEENVVDCYTELADVLRKAQMDYEIIFVDDGSKDRSIEVLSKATANDPRVVVVEFRRNFGQTAAMAAGLEIASKDVVVTLDGDLQNDPRQIPEMVAKIAEGYDLVAGWRANRQDKFFSRKLPSKIANMIISKMTDVHLHDYGCTLKAMTRELAQSIRLYGEMHRFIPALAAEVGAKVYEMPVNHRARTRGISKYGISRTLRVILDLMTVKFLLGFAKRPIHLFGTIGLTSLVAGGGMLTWITAQKLFEGISMGSRPLLPLGVMLILIGIQFLVFGLLAEILVRTYYESQNKKIYSVRRIITPGRTHANRPKEGDLQRVG